MIYVFDHAGHLESNNAEDVASDNSSRVAYASTAKSLNVPREVMARRDILVAYVVHNIRTRSNLQIGLHRLANLLPRNTNVKRENETLPTAQTLRELKDKRAES